MTDPLGSEDSVWLTITLSFTSGNSQLFPGPPESLKPDRFPVPLMISHYLYTIRVYVCVFMCVGINA